MNDFWSRQQLWRSILRTTSMLALVRLIPFAMLVCSGRVVSQAQGQFNAAQLGPIDVPIYIAAGEKSLFARLMPKFADGLRASGCSHVQIGLVHGAGHYVVEDQYFFD